MTQRKPSTIQLVRWYRHKVRPFLTSEEPGRIQELDREIEKLEQRERVIDKPMSACFVGGSGIGKSTLINALVAGSEIVVPSGGVGPLTAQALQIGYDPTPSFTAVYHPADRVREIRLPLESLLRKTSGNSESPDDEIETTSPNFIEEKDDFPPSEGADDSDKTSKIEHLRKQSQLLITGGQDSEYDLPYLVDSIRDIVGQKRSWGTIEREQDKHRLSRLRAILNTEHSSDSCLYEVDSTSPTFRGELHDHAAGFLAPIIQRLEVWWNSTLLEKGLELIDLPGLGIAGDVYRKVTEQWVRSDAHVIVLVVNHRGVTESDADLLRHTGFLTRLLHSIDDPAADPIRLVIAVVKTDEIAVERYFQAKDKSKKKAEHLADVMSECRSAVRSQIRDRLTDVWTSDGDALKEGKAETIVRIVNGLKIFPVSAIEYRKLLTADDEDRSFLQKPEQSGLTDLADGLGEMAAEHLSLKLNRFEEALTSFRDRLASTLNVIKAKWEERTRAKEEAESLQKELDFFLQPLREEFRARQGAYRNFLKETLPGTIERVVLGASNNAKKTIRGYLAKLRDAHWKTLQAAVSREGTFYGSRHINLPSDFAQAFEDPIAEAWSKTILKELRKHTKEFSEDCLSFVDKVVEWAKSKGGRVQPRLIELQRDAIAADTKHLSTVGKEAVDELRDKVKSKLSAAIEGPIRRRCKNFVARKQHVGLGVKSRILELFGELADEAVEAAMAPAQKVLLDNYQIVEQEILEAWKEHQDPLASASNAIVSSHEDSVRRSDAQKRRAVIESVDLILADKPQILEPMES